MVAIFIWVLFPDAILAQHYYKAYAHFFLLAKGDIYQQTVTCFFFGHVCVSIHHEQKKNTSYQNEAHVGPSQWGLCYCDLIKSWKFFFREA